MEKAWKWVQTIFWLTLGFGLTMIACHYLGEGVGNALVKKLSKIWDIDLPDEAIETFSDFVEDLGDED